MCIDFKEKFKSVQFFFSFGIVQIEGWVDGSAEILTLFRLIENGTEK